MSWNDTKAVIGTFRDWISVLVLVALGLLFTLAFASSVANHAKDIGRDDERKAAIEAGAARWAIDPATGERRFEYLRAKEDQR